MNRAIQQLLFWLLLCSHLMISCDCGNETVGSPTKPPQHPSQDHLPTPSPNTDASNQGTTGSQNTPSQDPSNGHQPTPELSELGKKLKELEEQQKQMDEENKRKLEESQKQAREQAQKLQEILKAEEAQERNLRFQNVKKIEVLLDSIKENIQKVDAAAALNTALQQDINKIFDQINQEEKEIKEEIRAALNYLASTEKGLLISDSEKEKVSSLGLMQCLLEDLESYKEELYNILASRRQELNNPVLEAAYKKRTSNVFSGTSNRYSNSSSKSFLTDERNRGSKIFSFIRACEELFPELLKQLTLRLP